MDQASRIRNFKHIDSEQNLSPRQSKSTKKGRTQLKL